MTTNKASRKDRKDKKDIKRKSVAKLRKSVAKLRRRSTRRKNINKTYTSNLSDLYTYESPVTNKSNSSNSNYNVQNNVNVVHGLKDFLAVKK